MCYRHQYQYLTEESRVRDKQVSTHEWVGVWRWDSGQGDWTGHIERIMVKLSPWTTVVNSRNHGLSIYVHFALGMWFRLKLARTRLDKAWI